MKRKMISEYEHLFKLLASDYLRIFTVGNSVLNFWM